MNERKEESRALEESEFYIVSKNDAIARKYTILMILSGLIKFIALAIVLIMAFVITILPSEFGLLERLAIVVPAVICSIIVFSVGSLITLLVDIESNQRLQLENNRGFQEKIAKLLEELANH